MRNMDKGSKWNSTKILEFVQSLNLTDLDYPLCYGVTGTVQTMSRKVLFAGRMYNAKMITYTANKMYYDRKDESHV